MSAHTLPLPVFAAHHKCATQWFSVNLEYIAYALGRNPLRFQLNHYEEPEKWPALHQKLQQEQIGMALSTDSNYAALKALPPHRAVHIVRDPRDIIVSAYFSHLYSHPTRSWTALRKFRARLQEISKAEALFEEMDFLRDFLFKKLLEWDYSDPEILELRQEEVTANPQAFFRKMLRFWGLLAEDDDAPAGFAPRANWNTLQYRVWFKLRRKRQVPGLLRFRQEKLPPARLDAILEQFSFQNLSKGRNKGAENKQSHYRKGVPGDWKNHFTEEHKAEFKRRFGDLLIRMGYETDNSW